MASTDALPIPRKNAAYRVVFPILDADGDLVAGATGLDSEVSKDQGTFADCTNEATEIASSSGMYYLDLTATEMNADCVCVIVKTSSSGAKTTPLVLYPEEAGDIRVNVTQFGGTNLTATGGRPEVNASHWGGTAVGSANVRANVVQYGGAAGTFASGRPEVNASHVGGSAVSQSGGLINANVTQISGDAAAADNAESFFDGTGYAGTNNVIPTVTNLTNAPGDSSGTTTLLSRLTSTRAGYLDNISAAAPTAAANATAVRSELTTELGRIDVVVSTRLASASYTAPDNTGITAIKAKTDNLPSDPADASVIAGRFDTIDTNLGTVGTAVDGIKSVTDTLADTLEDDGGTYRFTANALEQAPTGGSAPTASEIADAVWDENASGHVTSGTTGAALAAAGAGGDPWETSLPGAYGSGTAGKIIGDNLNAAISSRSSHSAADVWAVGTRTLTGFGTLVADIATAVWGAASRTLTAFGFSVTVGTNNDKAGYELTSAYDPAKTAAQAGDEMDLVDAPNGTALDAISVNVESHLLDEGDSQLLINAIVGAIGNVNVDEAALVAAIRADLERSGGNLNTLLARLTSTRAANIDNLDAAVSTRASQSSLNALHNVSQAEVQSAATAALNAYDPPTRAEATADKDAVIAAMPDVSVLNDLTVTDGNVHANVKAVNDVNVIGTGTEGSEWGPEV